MTDMLYQLSDREAEIIGDALSFYAVYHDSIKFAVPLDPVKRAEITDLLNRWFKLD